MTLGVIESGYEHGEKSATYALDIINGTPASSLPIQSADNGIKMFNEYMMSNNGLFHS